MFFILIYKSNAILMKISAAVLLELETLFLKCKQSNEWWRKMKPLLKNKLGGTAALPDVVLGFCNKTLPTRELINNRNVSLTVLEAGTVRSGCQGVGLPPGCILTWQKRARELCGSFHKNTKAVTRAPLLGANHLLRVSPTSTVHFGGLGNEFWGNTNIQTLVDIKIPMNLELAVL